MSMHLTAFVNCCVCDNGAVLCSDVAVLCYDVAVLCSDVAVLCYDVAVLCSDVAVLRIMAYKCFLKIFLAFRFINI